jgi:hypothetical protein
MEPTSTTQFDLNTYLTDNYYTIDLEPPTNDIFDELEAISKPASDRRFSFSIPENLDNIPPAPPPSPRIDSTAEHPSPRLTLHIPEEKDDDFDLESFELESNPPTPTNIQPTLDFSKESLLVSSPTNHQIYKRPPRKAHDARKVWRYAKIPSAATIREIECKLLDWAYTYASLEITNKKIVRITWRTHSNCVCTCKWETFLKWIVCASLAV